MSTVKHKLRAEDIDVYINNRHILRNFSIQIHSGEIVALLGVNGSGKSTAFSVMSGLRQHSDGCVLLDGNDISTNSFSDHAASGIIYLPQESSLFKALSVSDNIMAVLEMRPDLTPEQCADKTSELLQYFRLIALRNQVSDSLSGGERRRLEIARAMAMRPKFLLLDEPFAAMDPISITELKTILRDLKATGPGILITDHNLQEVLEICDYSYILHDGEIISHGVAKAVLADTKVRKLYTGELANSES